jgi:hypothetical protein
MAWLGIEVITYGWIALLAIAGMAFAIQKNDAIARGCCIVVGIFYTKIFLKDLILIWYLDAVFRITSTVVFGALTYAIILRITKSIEMTRNTNS